LILADGQRLVLKALAALLERDFTIVTAVHGAEELLRQLPGLKAECLLLDLELRGRNGYLLIPAIRRVQPSLRILMVTMLADRVMADACVRAGASGFIPKDADDEELRLAIREVVAGQRYISPLVPKSSHRVGLDARHPNLGRLTFRQEQIVLMLGEGRSGVYISNRLALSPSTVTFHKRNIVRVLGLEDEADLLRLAVLVRAGVTDAD
jgi:DNA-binding NarL/FixJ family response regulator